MIRIRLDPLCAKRCKRKKCPVCHRCTHPSCPRPDSKCNCTESSNNDLLILSESRSTKWDGHITPGIDVPIIPLTLDIRQQDKTAIESIDKFMPNMIESLDAAELSEVNQVLSLNTDPIPGKSRRWHSTIKDFSIEEIV